MNDKNTTVVIPMREQETIELPTNVLTFFKENKHLVLSELLLKFENTAIPEGVALWYFSTKGRHNNNRANSQEVIAKLYVSGIHP